MKENRALDGQEASAMLGAASAVASAGQGPAGAARGASPAGTQLLTEEIKREFHRWLQAFQTGDLEGWRNGSVKRLEHVFEFSIETVRGRAEATRKPTRRAEPQVPKPQEEPRTEWKAYSFLAADAPTWEAIFHVIQRSLRWSKSEERGPYDRNFVIVGPPGAGKTSFAALVHALMARTGPFVSMPTGGIVETMLLADLFGVTQGYATTTTGRRGVIEVASAMGRATLFIDEFLDLPALQGALLRLLQDRQYQKLGEVGTRTARNLLVILATNLAETPEALKRLSKPPPELVRPGATGGGLVGVGGFWGVRADLYGRFGPVLALPPLSERPQALKRLIVDRLKFRGVTAALGESVLEELRRRPWVGNIRELFRFVDDVADFHPEGEPLVHLPGGLPGALAETDLERVAAAAVTEAVVQGIEPWRSLMKPRGDPEVRGVVIDEFVRRRLAQMAEGTREAAYEVFQRFAIESGFESVELLNKSLPKGRRMRAVATRHLTPRPGAGLKGGPEPAGEDD